MITRRPSGFVSRIKRIKIDLINYIINYADRMVLGTNSSKLGGNNMICCWS